MTRVSVLLFTYNGAKFLDETMRSIFKQTYGEFELIVVDDASTDQTGVLLDSYRSDSRLKLVRNQENRGIGHSFNRALSLAQGDYICQIGQDDVWESHFLEHSIQFMDQNLNVVASFGNVEYIDEKSNAASINIEPFRHQNLSGAEQAEIISELHYENWLCASASIFRRACLGLEPILGDNDQLQDWALWLHLLWQGDFAINSKARVRYRLHESNASLREVAVSQMALERDLVLEHSLSSVYAQRFLSTHPKGPEILLEIIRRQAQLAPYGDWPRLSLRILKHYEHQWLRIDKSLRGAAIEKLSILFWSLLWWSGALVRVSRHAPRDLAWPEGFPMLMSRYVVFYIQKNPQDQDPLLLFSHGSWQFGPFQLLRLSLNPQRFGLIPWIFLIGNRIELALERRAEISLKPTYILVLTALSKLMRK